MLFHTAFKFGGIVSVAFWSMVAVVASGVIGRFIYIQIPRTIEGRELSLQEVKGLKLDIPQTLHEKYQLSDANIQLFVHFAQAEETTTKTSAAKLRSILKSEGVAQSNRNSIMSMLRRERSLSKKISRLNTMQRLFKYWHVAHLPFALIMAVILVIHVAVTLAFGYKWIF